MPAESLFILKADKDDLPDILALQKTAYQSEARLVGDFTIPPLMQTLESITSDYENGIILKACRRDDASKIIGSVRGRLDGGTLHIGRLMVDPAYQNQGIGTQLLVSIEALYPHARYELFTGEKSVRNLSLYTKNGYMEYKREVLNNYVAMVYLEKNK